MNNKEVCNAFAYGTETGCGSNIFISNNTIYSYGTHFPMAVRVGEVIIMHNEKYSRTTSKHQHYLRMALEHGRYITEYVKDIDEMNKRWKELKEV